MIVPNKFFHTKAATELRRLLVESRSLQQIVDFGDAQVFHGPTNYCCIVLMQRDARRPLQYIRAEIGLDVRRPTAVCRSSLSAELWHFAEPKKQALFRRIEGAGEPLGALVARFGTGVQSGADRVLTLEPAEARKARLEKAVLRRMLRGRDVRRYIVAEKSRLLIFPYKVQKRHFSLLSERELKKHRRVFELLSTNQRLLRSRIWFGKTARQLSGEWYGMMYLDSYQSFSAPHILTPSLSNQANFALGQGTLFATGTAGVTSLIFAEGVREDIKYLLGLLNSRLLSAYAVAHSPVFSGTYYKFSGPYLKRLPIRRIDFSSQADKAAHDEIVGLVDAMLTLHKHFAAAKSARQKEAIQRQIEATDAQIDRLVYDLYGLTKKEIAVVEGARA